MFEGQKNVLHIKRKIFVVSLKKYNLPSEASNAPPPPTPPRITGPATREKCATGYY